MILCLLVWLGPSGGRAKTPSVEIRGNRVMVDEVYLALLDLPPNARADNATAQLVRRQLLGFLRRAGYVMAAVRAKAVDDAIQLEVDEGRLEKVVFFGRGTLKTLQLRLKLDLPHQVFNQPQLERQLKLLQKKYQIKEVSYKLVPTRRTKHPGPQIEDLGEIQGRAVIPQSARYELHIYLGRGEWDAGLDLDLEYNFPDGLSLGASYKGIGLLFGDDRWQVGAGLGVRLYQGLQSGDPELALSRVLSEARWYTPALVGKRLRPFVWLLSDLKGQKRLDLQVDNYYSESLEVSLNLGYELIDGLMFSVGGGVEERLVFGVEQASGAAFPVGESASLRPLILGKLDLVLETGQLRRGRRHQLVLEARHFWVEGEHSLGKATVRYQKVFEFGWHDLWVKSRGAWLWGEIQFDDEEPVGGRYVRGCFGDRYFVQQVGSLVLEFRLSLARDLFKVSVFHDLAGFGKLDRTTGGESFQVADSFGLGFHALILDAFQLDVYYGLGFSSDQEFDQGFSASLKKVF